MQLKRNGILALICAVISLLSTVDAFAQTDSIAIENIEINADTTDSIQISKVLFIGDSMTGWLAERLNAYGDINGFEVATIVWDGSTITKWADAKSLPSIIERHHPDAIFVSLGMNELFEQNPSPRLESKLDTLKKAFGETPFLWIGPPSWPGHDFGEKLNTWLSEEAGEGNYFDSFNLELRRQSKNNPHPSRQGIEDWIDAVVEWIPGNTKLNFKSLDPPEKGKLSRGKDFIYKRMKEKL